MSQMYLAFVMCTDRRLYRAEDRYVGRYVFTMNMQFVCRESRVQGFNAPSRVLQGKETVWARTLDLSTTL